MKMGFFKRRVSEPTGYLCQYCGGAVYWGDEVFEKIRGRNIAYHHACYDDDIIAVDLGI